MNLFCSSSFIFLSTLYSFFATLYCCRKLSGEGNIKRQKKSGKKILKRRQSNNKVAKKNMERLGMALLGFRT